MQPRPGGPALLHTQGASLFSGLQGVACFRWIGAELTIVGLSVIGATVCLPPGICWHLLASLKGTDLQTSGVG